MANQHWLKHTERALVVGSGIGTVASIAAQNVAFASAPLTVLAAVGLLNRNRMEKQLSEAQEKLARQQRQAGHRLTNLTKQVTALPSPEALTNFQRSVMDRNNRSFVQFSQEIQGLREYVIERFQMAQTPDLSQVYQDIAQLQDQYALASTSVQNLTAQVQRLATIGRVEATETKLSQLKTDLMQIRVTLESLRLETRHTVSNLQDTIDHLEHHYQDLPRVLQPYQVKPDSADLMKAVANLVSQTEFNSLAEHVKELARQQANLARDLTKIPVSSVKGLGLSADSSSYDNIMTELERTGRLLHHLQDQVSRQETAGHTHEQVQQMASQYLGQLKAQLSQLEGVTQSLAERQQSLANQLAVVPGGQPSFNTRQVLAQMAKRLKQSEAEINTLKQTRVDAISEVDDQTTSTWIIDFPTPASVGGESSKSASRQALELALDNAQHRLLLVWPWASQITIDDDLLKRFTRLLERGAHLELGWCHQGNQQEGRLMARISQRWGTEPTQMAMLKLALNQLLPLREQYPDRFKFKIMGTAESYIVCDSGLDSDPDYTYAIVSLQPLPTQSVSVPGVEAKLRTSDRQVVEALTQRFHNPSIDPGDAIAFFNRGTTRHDLRDQPSAISDYSQVLALQPNHAVALNNRGAAYLELNQPDEAELDLSEAINHDPRQFAAYCNRGWLRLDQRRYPAAVQDFTKAIELKPHLPMAYVYRGSALQKLGDLKGAVRDYSDAIACGDPVALPYCYRSAVYESQGDAERAIADLERAQAHLQAQGDQQALTSVQRTLQRLQSRVRG